MRRSRRTILLGLVATAGLAGCGGADGDRSAASGSADGAPVRPAQTLPIPGDARPQLPAGHPPLEDSTARGMTWDVPPGWVEVEPASSMRVAQYRIDGPAGSAECVVFYFGPNQGGGALANAERWAGQFTQPDGSSSLDRMIVTEIDGSTGKAQVVEVTGTYDGGMTMTDQPATPRPASMLLGGIVPGPDAPWFFKLTGPEDTVRSERERFVALLRSVRATG